MTSTNTHTATTDIIQVTWVQRGRMYSREWVDTDENRRGSARAYGIALRCSGASQVSQESIPAGRDYTIHGEH